MSRLFRAPTLTAFALVSLLALATESFAYADVAPPPASAGQSRFIYAAAVAGLVAGGVIAYYRSKNGPSK